MQPLNRVVVFGLGGTIASIPGAGEGVAPELSADEIVRAVPDLARLAEIECVAFRKLPGAHLRLQDLTELAAAIEARLISGAQGVVVMQGTDTIEETAFALDLLVAAPGAVVVTGAMRNPTVPGADGPANLLGSVTVAASGRFRDTGAVVVLNDAIHAAKWVRKAHASAPSAFVSPMTGPIGWLSEGRAVAAWSPPRAACLFSGAFRSPPAEVASLATWPGDDGRLVQAAVAAGYEGLVVAGLGGGHVASPVADALEQAARDIPVVLASRTGAGEVLRQTYSFVGSEMDLAARGLLSAGFLGAEKARLLLALLLSRSHRSAGEAAADFASFTTL